MVAKMSRVTITGATGFIGRSVLAEAVRRNCQITLLGRQPSSHLNHQFFRWNLEGGPAQLPRMECDALIHIAADMRPEDQTIPEAEEVARARELFEFFPENVLVVFISSQASRPDAPTRYGRVKFQIERLVEARSGIIIRPGLVYSAERDRGLHSRLRGLLAKLPAIPDFVPRPVVQPIHVEDLARAVMQCATDRVAKRTYHLGDPEGVTFTEYLRLTARLQISSWRPAVPVPATLVMLALPVLRLLKLTGRIDPVSLKSLLSGTKMPTAGDLEALHLQLRPLREGLRPNGQWRLRELIAEGSALTSYLLGRRAPLNLIKRYVRAIMTVTDGAPMGIRTLYVTYPKLVRLCEGRGFLASTRDPQFEMRLDIATRLVESSIAGAAQFMQTRPVHAVSAVAGLFWAVFVDLVCQAVTLPVKPTIRDEH